MPRTEACTSLIYRWRCATLREARPTMDDELFRKTIQIHVRDDCCAKVFLELVTLAALKSARTTRSVRDCAQ